MDSPSSARDARTALREMLGYLNFSSGAPDARFQRNINAVYQSLQMAGPSATAPWREIPVALRTQLHGLKGSSEAFTEVDQAEAVITLLFDHLLAAYREYHRDLLYHQTEDALYGPFFLARCFEAVLAQGSPWDETERIVRGAVEQLNDFIGYRPVAVLRTARKIEPYEHEWVRPLPLYLRGAGVAAGRYEEVVQLALDILHVASPELLEQAYFDLNLLDELALDPRAYDFDHPVNKRPNYHFGMWDPHQIDNQGRYRRFVVQQVTLDALLSRVGEHSNIPRGQMLYEAAAVLAGTMLMAAGISGRGPDTHDSSVTLATLLPRIAAYRDKFYQQLLAALPDPHGQRLRQEAVALRQPFGAARQHLNHRMARLRAKHLQHVHLAHLFALMGHPQASSRQARVLPVPAPRMVADIDGRLTIGHTAIEQGRLEEAFAQTEQIEDLLRRSIECGALIDPWNILGFGGQFSLFPAVENSVRDHRIDQLTRLLQRILNYYARLVGQAAALGQDALGEAAAGRLDAFAQWWDKFATTEVSGVQSVSGRETAESAALVARALGAWHKAGTAAGNIAFWREYVVDFSSPKAYALVVNALLEQGDLVASMALFMQWLSQAEQVALEDNEFSFGTLAVRWVAQVRRRAVAADPGQEAAQPPATLAPWPLLRRFFDHLEANADEYWQPPRFEDPGRPVAAREDKRDEAAGDVNEEPDEDASLYGAAYDEVVYRDSTADGHEGDTLDEGHHPTEYELDFEQNRLGKRLGFLAVVAELWKMAAQGFPVILAASPGEDHDHQARLAAWLDQAQANLAGLNRLLAEVDAHPIPPPRSTHESMCEYDRRRIVKETLLERIVGTSVAMADAARAIRGALPEDAPLPACPAWQRLAHALWRAMTRGEVEQVRQLFPPLVAELRKEPLLYIPLSRQGDPQKIVQTRILQLVIRDLLSNLPRLGLLGEACQLIEAAQAMEREHPVGPGGVTEFDRLFEIGYQAIVESLVAAADQAEASGGSHRRGSADHDLIETLQIMTEAVLKRWLTHSRSLRLSVLEKVNGDEGWHSLTDFIERYGHDLFTQMFLNLGNVRAVLHQGVPQFLQNLEEQQLDEPPKLLEELDRVIPRAEAITHLELVLEAVVDNYAEYLDYNTTTTQSDRGESLYTLLDFLRLKAAYDRVAWNLRPALMAHEILVRSGRNTAAELWRRALVERTALVSDRHLARLNELCQRYGMRLATVADRLSEKFVQPLAIDRLRSLVKPAMRELQSAAATTSFDLLEQEIEEFSQTPMGVGIDVPGWLSSLEQEVSQVRQSRLMEEVPYHPVPQAPLSLDEIQLQMRQWDEG